MATWQNFLETLSSPAAASTGAALVDTTTDANAPDLDDLVEASADRAEGFDDGDDDVIVYEPPRPSIADTTEPAPVHGHPTTDYAGVAPVSALALSVTVRPGDTEQLVPPSGGVRRRVVVKNSAEGQIFVSPDRRDDDTGYRMGTNQELETNTQGPVWIHNSSNADRPVYVWVDYYPSV